jgi:hypothetical protein
VKGDEGRSEAGSWPRADAERSETPRNARRRELTCILQKGMQTLLEGLQRRLLPHFADEEGFAHAAGVSLKSWSPCFLYRVVILLAISVEQQQ